jgi:hypothetical protein
MTDRSSESHTSKNTDGEPETVSDQRRRDEPPKKGSDGKQPEPAKDVGDETPNPLPDNPGEGDGGSGAGGDPGRA